MEEKQKDNRPGHTRDYSFHVTYKPDEIPMLAKEIVDGTIAEVHLSLFTYWIQQKEENYKEAKKYIRELGLDQRYPTSRIKNEVLRKLVDDVVNLRPHYKVTEGETSDGEKDSDHRESLLEALNSPQEPKHRASLLTPFRFPSMLKTMSSEQSAKHTSTKDSRAKVEVKENPPSAPLCPRNASPWVTKTESMLSMRKQSAPSDHANSFKSSRSKYPPDTPDRPAPLNWKLRGPDSAPAIGIARSVSTPVTTNGTSRYTYNPAGFYFPQRPLPSPYEQNGAQRRAVNKNDVAEDIFDSRNAGGQRRGGRFVDALRETTSSADGDGRGTEGIQSRREIYTKRRLESTMGSPQADRTTRATGLTNLNYPSQVSTIHREGRGADSTPVPQRSPNAGIESLIVADDAASDSSTQSAESPSQLAEAHSRARATTYSLIPRLVPRVTPAQRRAAAQARRDARPTNIAAQSAFHRLLPLRSYESEAYLFPTVRDQTSRSHLRSSSLNASPLRARPGAQNSTSDNEDGDDDNNSRGNAVASSSSIDKEDGEQEEEEEHAASVPHPPASPSLSLSLFPAVPASSAPSPAALATAYRSITTAHIRQALVGTRARGAQLPTAEAASLSRYERAWRETHAELLASVYGRADAVLGPEDVRLVNKIARELREGVGRCGGYEWVGELFRGE